MLKYLQAINEAHKTIILFITALKCVNYQQKRFDKCYTFCTCKTIVFIYKKWHN